MATLFFINYTLKNSTKTMNLHLITNLSCILYCILKHYRPRTRALSCNSVINSQFGFVRELAWRHLLSEKVKEDAFLYGFVPYVQPYFVRLLWDNKC